MNNVSFDSSTGEYPLSYGQRALWFLQKLAPESAAYNLVYATRIPIELDLPAFRRALQRLVERHPILRTTFAACNGEPVQRVHADMDGYLEIEDASAWSEAELHDRLAAEVFRPFDLERGPLMRMLLFSRSPRDHIFIPGMHHLVTDLWSFALFLRELGEFYTAETTGVPLSLKPVEARYTDYVDQQAAMLAGPEGERLWAYWQKQLAGELPLLNLPTDRPRPAIHTFRGAALSRRFSVELTSRLKALAQAHGATLYTLALAVLQVLLHRYTGQDDILVGSPKAGRSRKFARTLGYFINPLILRGDLSGDPPFTEFLARTRRLVLDAFEHGDYPFPLLIERLQPMRDPSRPQLVQVVLAWQKTSRVVSQDMTMFALNQAGGRMDLAALPLESATMEQRVAPVDLTLQMGEVNGELVATMEYNTDLFDTATIARMLGHMQTLMEGIVADPAQRVSTLPLLTAVEREDMLVAWNDTGAAFPADRCIHQLFEAQVVRTPDAEALVFENQRLTYADLNARANQLAHYLQQLGVGPETLVGICTERSLEMIIGVLGVLKAGGAYVPLDPTYPPERLAFMLADARVSVLLTRGSPPAQAGAVPGGTPDAAYPRVVRLDADWPSIAQEPDTNPASAATPDTLAYVIYTSGSTGRPKGAMLEHRGVCNLALFQRRAFAMRPGKRVLQFAPFSFDASVWEMVMALCNGATLCLARQAILASGPDLLRLLRQQRITTVTLPPSVLAVLDADDLPGLETVIAAGEACTTELVARWAPGRRFFNAYGPTETTVCASMALCDLSDPRPPSIGRPIDNFQLYILDQNGQPVPIGVPGELHIGGVGVARGYLNRPNLTAEQFVPNPFAALERWSAGALERWSGAHGRAAAPHAPAPQLHTSPAPQLYTSTRLYRTGDLARFRPDGSIEFLGRIDHQVKIRGFRIELGEIEAVLRRHPAVQEGVVVAREDTPGDPRLVAYVMVTAGPHAGGDQPPTAARVADQQAAGGTGELRAFLREHLPDYMVPAAILTLEALPLTPNGKVDRAALPAPHRTRADADTTYVQPQTELERIVAAIWQEVLHIEKVGIYDTFFDLGGHSLLMAKIHSKLQEALAREFSLIEMFKYPTISSFVESLHRQPDSQPGLEQTRERASRQKAAIARQRQRRQASLER